MQEDTIIVRAQSQEVQSLVNFQILLAKESQNLDLIQEIIIKGVKYLVEELKDQFYLVAKVNNKVVGCIMTNAQNSEKAWIQSVYVLPQYRKRGIFKKLFTKLCELQKERGIKTMYLYADEENEKAIAAYNKLGMSIVKGISMYGFDFILSKDAVPETTREYGVKPLLPQNHTNNLVNILKTDSQNLKQLSVFDGETLVGHLEYFEEFSDWRYGRTINIMRLLLNDEQKRQVLAFIVNYMKQKLDGISVSAIRFFTNEECFFKETYQVPRLHYYVMSIDL